MIDRKKITICTGIFPPEIGGPAQYAEKLAEIWESEGNKVQVEVFSKFNFLPTGIRHFAYFLSIIPAIVTSDFVLALDTYSCALPALVASKLLGKKMILRTGGDFLWEFYVERTGDKVLLKDFYNTRMDKFSLKEKIVFNLTKMILRGVDGIIWSTKWQRDIFMQPYSLERQKNFIVENYYGPKSQSALPASKNFISMTRKLKWKDTEKLEKIFSDPSISSTGATLDTKTVVPGKFKEKLAESYAVIIASLGDISPNTIMDAISLNKPFILTEETGIYDRVKDIAIFIDPQNLEDIKEKVLWLLDGENYELQKEKLKKFNFEHNWKQISDEFLEVYKYIK